jgi:dolichyl-diphosphooligosaccharide--protein glycosyltransferase
MTWLQEYYHIPTILFIIAFALWNRIRNWSSFVINGEVLVQGNDPWYHMRSTEYVVQHFPSTMPYEVWTQFPVGTSTGQFGTLFDQVIAFFALVAGLGSPDQFTIRFLVMISPVFWTALLTVPTYIIGRRIGGRFGGITALGFIAFAPDRLLLFSIAGFPDHHVGEALFMALSVLGVMVALSSAEKHKPVYELVAAREFETLRRPVGWSLLAGIATGMYIWVWPPGVWIYGILGTFFVLHLSIEHVRGQSPEHPAFVGTIVMATAAIMQLSTFNTLEISATSRSLLQPGLGLAVAAGIVFLAWLSRQIDSRDTSRYTYPAVVAGSIVGTTLVFAFVLPDLFGFFLNQVNRVLGFITPTGETAGTIGEFQAGTQDDLERWYKLSIYTAILGAAILLAKQLLGDERRGEKLLIVVWAAFMISGTLTQARFGYYLTVPVGALNAALVGFVLRTMGGAREKTQSIELYQVFTIFAVVMVMFVPMFGAVPLMDNERTPRNVAEQRSTPGNVLGWNSSLQWMSDNTPAEGQYANPDGEELPYLGQFDRTDDFEYPDGTYGVMSWWDYGHWITAHGERIPNANPFQQGVRDAADFLVAQSEATAQRHLEENADENDQAKTRYVMVDWKMVETESSPPLRGKFFAPTVWNESFEQSDFYTRLGTVNEQGGIQTLSMIQKEPYYKSMAVRLYHYHGSAQTPRVPGLGVPVVEWQGAERDLGDGRTLIQAPTTEQGTLDRAVTFANNTQEARQMVQDNPSAQIGGIGAIPNERVPALEHFRLVQMSDVSALGRSDGALRANENGLGFALPQFTRRTIASTGLGAEIGERIGNQSLTQRQVSRMMQQRTQLGRTIQSVGERRVLFPNTAAWTKVFERVPGATIEGENAPANSTITLSVPMQPENGPEFIYRQRVQTNDDGEFTTTVPYSTTGYDEIGVEDGYTDVNVRANGSYRIQETGRGPNGNFTLYSAQFNVTEAQVVGEDPSPVEVNVTQQTPELSPGSASASGGDESGDGEQSSDESGSDESSSDESSSDDSSSNSEQSDDSGGESSQSDGSSENSQSNAIAPVSRIYSTIQQRQTAL